MEAIIKDSKTCNYPGIVKFVLSNNPDALGIIKAKNLGIKTFVFPVNKNNSMEIFEKKFLNLLIKEKIELICLAGFMKILRKVFKINFWNNANHSNSTIKCFKCFFFSHF